MCSIIERMTMEKRRGRPCKTKQISKDNKQSIIQATIQLIKQKGASYITVRHVCEAALVGTGTFYYYFKNKDDLLIHFLKDTEFAHLQLISPHKEVALRQAELYQHLIQTYQNLGLDFMYNFYSVENQSLSTYMGTVDGKFIKGTVMDRSENELRIAQEQGYLPESTDIHTMAIDICTIVKGSIFEWCLSKGRIDINQTLNRLIHNYIQGTITNDIE